MVSSEDPEQHTPVERHVKRSFEDEALIDQTGQPLTRRQRQTRRTVEQYIRAGVAPAYMRRLMNIERELERHRRKLGRLHRSLSEEERQQLGITAGLVRLSVGIEDASDIIADLAQAFDATA